MRSADTTMSEAAPIAVPDNANEGCVGPQSDAAGKASACAGCPNQAACASGAAKAPDPAVSQVSSYGVLLDDVVASLLDPVFPSRY